MQRKQHSKWPVLKMMAAYTGLCLIATYMYAGGIFYVELLAKYGEGEVKTNLVGTLNTALTSFLAPFVGIISKRFSCRVSIVIGGILVSTGLFLSAWASSILQIIIYYGVISGAGNAMVGPSLTVVPGYYIEKHREFFVAMTAPCIGLGMFIATPVSVFLIDTYGISGTYLIFSGIVLHFCVFGIICKPSEVENLIIQDKKMETQHKGIKDYESTNTITTIAGKLEENEHNIGVLTNTGKGQSGSRVKEMKVFSRIDFILFLLGTFAWNYLLSVIQLHLPYHLKEAGKTNSYISIIMSCFSICNAAGRLISALSIIFQNKLDGLIIYIVSLAIGVIGTATFPLYSAMSAGPYIFGITTGLMTGIPNGVMPAITLNIVGLQNMSTGYAVGCFFSGFGNIIGPIIASALFDYFGSYSMAFVLTGCVVFSGSICSLTAKTTQRLNDRKTS